MEGVVAGRTISGKYRLERKLGQGGMGQVWIARHLQLDADVALKLLATDEASSPEARARFEREARAAAAVKSPHIVSVFDYGVDGETAYLAMDLLDGEDLEVRLKRVGTLSPAAALAVASPLAKGLRRIHEAGLAHRDLKPSNVFLERLGDEDHVRILDFGIARATSPKRASDVTSSGMILGSPPYMSPEQVLAKKELDHRTDLWSLGVILFRAMTGQLPFQAEVLTLLLIEISMAPVPLASQMGPHLGVTFDAFFAKALAREPAERFQTAAELVDAFTDVVRGVDSEAPRGRESRASLPDAAAAGDDATVPAAPPDAQAAPAQSAKPVATGPRGFDEKSLGQTSAVAVPLRPGRGVLPAVGLGVVAAVVALVAVAASRSPASPATSSQPSGPQMADGSKVAAPFPAPTAAVTVTVGAAAPAASSAPAPVPSAAAVRGTAAAASPGEMKPHDTKPHETTPNEAHPTHAAVRPTEPAAAAPERATPPAAAVDAGAKPAKEREFW
ncbi:MAG TPA: serine/threonine-protein kinase [Byssovorax sp.]|jgi:serine/threonine-protein kinase